MAHICRGKKFVHFGPSFMTNLLQIGASHKNPHGFDRETCPLVGETIIPPSSRLVFSSHATWNNGRFTLNFGIIQGSFDLFYALIEFFRHLMSIIQIRTTNTCSSAPKWLEKSYMCPWGACLGPMEGMGMNSTVSASWLTLKHCESRFLNLHKSKTHQKIMKLGMVSRHSTYMSC
jgi:hypothetical protein